MGGTQNFYKGTGQPKISEDFYLYPSLAGNLTLSGNWVVIVFANSTALHPAAWNVEFWEKAPNGSIVWDSGLLSPSIVGGPAGYQGYVDVPIYGYKLTVTNLTHSFLAGDTLQVEVTVNTGSTVPLRLWYNSVSYPSGMILPSTGFATPYSVITEDANGTATRVFYTYWSQSQRKVIINAYVSDPFGGYDIGNVTIQIRDPTGSVIVNNYSMSKTSGSTFSFISTYQYVYQYSSNSTLGTYTLLISVVDNNGLHQYQLYGTYQPYIETISSHFSLGLPVPVTFKLTSASTQPLEGANVELYSGGHLYASGSTGPDGSVNITVFSGTFEVKVYWEGTEVYDGTESIINSTTILLPVFVFDPAFRVVTSDGVGLENALVFITYPNGSTGRDPYITNSLGEIQLMSQPAGNYSFLILYDDEVVADTSTVANFSWTVTPNGFSAVVPQVFSVGSQVYTITVNVFDNAGSRLTNASVLITSKSTGAVLGYELTKNGTVSLLLPYGTYLLEIQYHNVWWLTYYSNTTTLPVQVTKDMILSITMKNIPPPIWATLGFWLIVTPIVLVAVGSYFYYRRRSRPKVAQTGTISEK
ncbi:MAG: hypothetical protein QXE12_03750 [Conexivisphaerales archaeon]